MVYISTGFFLSSLKTLFKSKMDELFSQQWFALKTFKRFPQNCDGSWVFLKSPFIGDAVKADVLSLLNHSFWIGDICSNRIEVIRARIIFAASRQDSTISLSRKLKTKRHLFVSTNNQNEEYQNRHQSGDLRRKRLVTGPSNPRQATPCVNIEPGKRQPGHNNVHGRYSRPRVRQIVSP